MMDAIPFYLYSTVAMTGVAASTAIQHAWIGWRTPAAGFHRDFAIVCAVTSLAGIFYIIQQTLPVATVFLPCEWLLWATHLLTGMTLPRFIARFTGITGVRFRRTLSTILGICLMMLAIWPEGFQGGEDLRITSISTPWGEQVWQMESQPGPLYFLAILLFMAAFGWSFAASYLGWRRTRAKRQLTLFAGLVMIHLAMWNAIAWDILRIPSIPLIIQSQILLVLLMGFVLMEQAAEANAIRLRLAQVEQFATIGRLASGVAHDFGNVLTGVTGHADLLVEDLQDRPDLQPMAKAIGDAGRRGTVLVRQLMAMARGPADDHAGANAGNILREVASLVTAGNRGLAVRCDADPHLLVAVESVRLHAAILNLAVNARDAMPGGGLLILGAARRGPTPGIVLRHQPRTEDLVELWVTDSGTGIPREIVDRIFDFQFTTKGDRGTGLGLAQVDDLVQRCGGALAVESTPGVGTTMRLWLPALPEEAVPLRVRLPDEGTSLGPVLAAHLRRRGHQVITGPGEADVLLVDADGLADGVTRPEALEGSAPVVLLTSSPDQAALAPGAMILTKPVDVEAVEEALTKAAGKPTNRKRSSGVRRTHRTLG